MKGRLFILRCTAFFLILIFSQKTGTGLFLHSLFHHPVANNKTPQPENEKGRDLSYTCNCIDDFLMPLAEAEEPGYAQPVLTISVPYPFFTSDIPFHSTIFSPLRGPPTHSI